MNGIALLAVGAIACAACGDPGGSAAQPTAPSAPTTTVPEPARAADESGEANQTDVGAPDDDEAVEPATEVVVEEPPDDECFEVERRTVEVAAEAYYAEHGAWPTSDAELVEVGYLRTESTAFDLAADGTAVRVPGAECTNWSAGDVGDADDRSDDRFGGLPDTVDGWIDFMGEEMIAGLGGTECAAEVAAIVIAALKLNGFDGPDPESLDELEPYLDSPIERWTLTPDDDTPQPAPGSGCSVAGFDVDPAGSFPEPAPSGERSGEPDCLRIEERTLETAIEAYYAEHGTWPTSDQQLVDEGYLRVAFEAFDVGENGTVIEILGAPCSSG